MFCTVNPANLTKVPSQPRGPGQGEMYGRSTQASEASLRTNRILEFDDRLQGVADGPWSLTSSRYGVMALLEGGVGCGNSGSPC